MCPKVSYFLSLWLNNAIFYAPSAMGYSISANDGENMFTLDKVLKEDTYCLGDFPLCRLLLSKDANYPWFILVPRRSGVTEICDLSEADQEKFMQESVFLRRLLKRLFDADKLNVAALGNVVPQLHVHHIVRYKSDDAWPSPVWGYAPATPYSDQRYSTLIGQLTALSEYPDFRFAQAPSGP